MSSILPSGAFFAALRQACLAAGRGLQEGSKPPLLLFSLVMALGAAGFWLVVFLVWHAEVWQLSQTLAHGLLGSSDPAQAATATPVKDWAVMWAHGLQLGSWLLSSFMVVAAFFVLFLLTMQLMLELFLMSLAQRKCLVHYPSLQLGLKPHTGFSLWTTLKLWGVLVLGLPLLVIPGLGPILFLALVAYVGTRSLVNDALEGVATLQERTELVREQRWAILFLGLMMQAAFLIPLAGLMLASVMGASVCHLMMASLVEMRKRQIMVPT